jgi:hypothetical protein
MPALDALLGDLDAIPWSDMTHCRGSASDLPDLLRTMLAAPMASDRADARRRLWDAIQYQGSIFEPTSHVIPFVSRSLMLVRSADRAHLVAMLANLAYGYTMTEGQGTLRWVAEGDPERGAVEAQYARELAWVAATQRASWTAVEPLLALLETRDEPLSVEVPFALVALIDGAGKGAPPGTDLNGVARRFADAIGTRATRPATPKALMGYAFALGRLAARVPEWADRLRSRLSRAPLPVRCAIALGLLAVEPSDAAADVLAEALRARAEHEAWAPYPFPWRSGHLRFQLMRRLASKSVSDEAFRRALPAIAEVLRTDTNQFTFDFEGVDVLARAMGGAKVDDSTRRKDLPTEALALLDALFDNTKFWANMIGNVDNALRRFGMANDRAAWATMLEREAR